MGGQFCRKNLKFGDFNILQKILNRDKIKKLLNLYICDGKLFKNEMLIKNNQLTKFLKFEICVNYTIISMYK